MVWTDNQLVTETQLLSVQITFHNSELLPENIAGWRP